MTAFHDDDLRAMLEARADRLAPGASHEVMAGVRDHIREPRQGAAFSVLPVLTGRSPAFGAGWAAAAMIAVLAIVVMATRPQVAGPSPSAGGAGPSGVIGSPSASSPAVSSSPDALDRTISITQLRGAVNDGSADGKLFEVATTLEESPNIFCAQDPCAKQYDLAFVGGVITDERPGLSVKPARPDEASVPFEGTFVVTPWKGSLVLLGMLDGSLDKPVDAGSVASSSVNAGPGVIGIAAVSGRLVWEGAACPTQLPGDSFCDQFLLSYIRALAPGTALVPVGVVDPMLGVDLSQVDQVDGPFLVQTGTGARPTVFARYDASEVHIVRAPTVACDVPAGTVLPSCRRLMQLALERWSVAGEVSSVEVHQGPWTCPAIGTCHDVPAAQSAYVVVHASMGDWFVGLAFDERGNGLDVMPMPLASASPGISPGS